MTTLYDVVVKNRHVEGGNIAVMEFESATSAALPKVEPGAHIDVHLPNGMVRQYSLCQNQMTKESFALESYVTLNHVAARFLHLMKLKMGCKFRSVSQKFISTFKSQAQCIDWRWNRDYAINYDGISTCT